MIRMRLLGLWVSAFFLSSLPAVAQETATGIPAARLEALAERIEAARVEEHIPGLALAVVYGDEVIFARGFGVKNIDTKEPVTPETVFAVGSTTKAFTSALVAMMIDEGKMEWDDLVRKHLPLFELKDEKANERVTVRDLLCHRTGLTRTSILWGAGQVSPQTAIRHLTDAEPLAPFRSRFLYNNVQYSAAGYCSAVAAGTDWDSLLDERILGPLGMEHSGTSTELLTNNEMASQGYQWDPMLEKHVFKRVRPIASCAPAGAINSSVLDMTHWIRFQLAKGEYAGQRLLAAERFDEMRSPQVIMGPGVGYGLGWMLRQWKNRNIVEHGGNIDGFAAQVTLVPDEDLGYVLLANVTAAALQQGSIEIVLSSLLEEPKPAVAAWTEEQLQPYLGDYYLEALKANVTVNIDGGKLAIDIPGQTNFKMHWPNDAGRWVFELTDTIELSFADAVDGQVPELTVHQAGMEMKAKRASAEDGPDTGISLEDALALVKKGFGEADASAYRIIGRTAMKHQGASGDFEVIVSKDHRFRRTSDFGKFGRMEMCFDGQDVFSQQPGRPVEKLQGVEREAAFAENTLLLATSDWNDVFETIELKEPTEVEGEAVFVIEGKPAHLPASTFYVSQESGRIVRIDQGIIAAGIQTMTIRVNQGDFRQVGSLTLPFLSQSLHDATGLIENRIWSIEPYEVDDSTFVISEN